MQWCPLSQRLLISWASVADDKTNARSIVPQIILDSVKELGVSSPTLS